MRRCCKVLPNGQTLGTLILIIIIRRQPRRSAEGHAHSLSQTAPSSSPGTQYLTQGETASSRIPWHASGETGHPRRTSFCVVPFELVPKLPPTTSPTPHPPPPLSLPSPLTFILHAPSPMADESDLLGISRSSTTTSSLARAGQGRPRPVEQRLPPEMVEQSRGRQRQRAVGGGGGREADCRRPEIWHKLDSRRARGQVAGL